MLWRDLVARAHLDTTTVASKGFPLPATKEWGEGEGEGAPNNVAAAERNPSPRPSPRSCLAGRGSDALRTMVVVSSISSAVRAWKGKVTGSRSGAEDVKMHFSEVP